MTGYSQRLLIEKLGVHAEARAIILRAPAGYLELMPELPERAQMMTRLVGLFDFMQYFATSTEQLSAVLPNLKRHLQSDGMLWISWAKQTSPLHTGLTETMVRELGLKTGLVDVKVAALTDDWSGLKFVYRLADRPHS
jgi:hypothetical protein